MKKACVLIFVLMWITPCQATNVLWDHIEMNSYTDYIPSGMGYIPSGTGFQLIYTQDQSFWIDLPVICTRSKMTTTLTANPHDVVLMFSGNWVQASPGDVAMESTTRHLDEYFMHCWADDADPTCSVTPLTVRGNEDVYLMFATRVVGENLHYNYGWVQLRVTPDDVSLVHSAINLDGDPIVVGVWDVPEPSSLLLLAAGGVILALKRARVARGISK